MKRILVILLSVVLTYNAFANDFITAGLDAYANEDWSSAILSFEKALSLTGGRNEQIQYWIIMARTSAKAYNQALRDANTFIGMYPNSTYLPNIVYQKGRLECLTSNYENSIQTLYNFINRYTGHELVSSAYFWIGENLYRTGRLAEARKIFSLILLDYPLSIKYEAARYKIELIDQAKTQEELLDLLKLSHEENLKLAEEYNKQQRMYQQAMENYQKRIAGADKNSDLSNIDLEELAKLNQELMEEKRKNAELYDTITLLQNQNNEYARDNEVIEDLNKQLIEANKTNQELYDKIAMLEQQNSNADDENKVIADLNKQLIEANKKNQELYDRIKMLEERELQYANETEAMADLNKRLKEANDKNEELYARIEQLEKQVNETNHTDDEFAEIQKELTAEKEKNAEFYERLTELEKTNQELLDMIAKLQNQEKEEVASPEPDLFITETPEEPAVEEEVIVEEPPVEEEEEVIVEEPPVEEEKVAVVEKTEEPPVEDMIIPRDEFLIDDDNLMTEETADKKTKDPSDDLIVYKVIGDVTIESILRSANPVHWVNMFVKNKNSNYGHFEKILRSVNPVTIAIKYFDIVNRQSIEQESEKEAVEK